MAEYLSDPKSSDSSFGIDEDVENFLGEDGYFARYVDGFKYRSGQMQMAKTWQKSLKESNILVCEAGTGTGKTFAYLIPALLSRKKIVISTASKALQDQLVKKDLPAVFSILNIHPDFMALKGFSNYLCLERFESVKRSLSQTALSFVSEPDELTDEQLLLDDRHALRDIITDNVFKRIEVLVEMSNYDIARNTPNPDFAEVNSKFSHAVVSKITRSSDTCIGKKCRFYCDCFAYKARAKSIETKVVVINHSLFFSDIAIDDPFDPMSPPILLPKYRGIIFDEAHELPAIGREHLSECVSYSDVKKLKEDLRYLFRETTVPKKPFEERVIGLEKAYKELFYYLSGKENGQEAKRNFLYYKYKDYDPNQKDPYFKYRCPDEELRNAVGNLYKALKEYEAFVKSNLECAEDYLSGVVTYVHFKASTIVRIMNIDLEDREKNPIFGKYVATAEVGRKSFNLILTPLEISEIFGSYLDKCQVNGLGVLMTSATLMVAQNFSKFLRDIGAQNDTECMEVKSPFNYPVQAGVYMSGSFPDTNDETRIDGIVKQLRGLLESVEGGIFFLTTSKVAVLEAGRAIYRIFRHRRKIYSQYGQLSNSEMLERFKEDGKAVLIATSSFWAGVDVPGRALSLVIIDKLPFYTPTDPIFAARCRYFDANNPKKSSFMSISVPEAIIEFRQGVGRLIRHENDHGALVICDPRIETARYSGMFKKSLPEMTVCSSLQDLEAFMHHRALLGESAVLNTQEGLNENSSDSYASDDNKYTDDSVPFEDYVKDTQEYPSEFSISAKDKEHAAEADIIRIDDSFQ